MISHFCSTVLQASQSRLIHLQLKWASYKARVVWIQRGNTPKIKVFQPIISFLGLKSLNLPAIVLSVARKATELQTASNGVTCSLCLHLQAKIAQKMKKQFPNRETDFAKECLWLLIWFWFGMQSWCLTFCCYGCKAATAMQQSMLAMPLMQAQCSCNLNAQFPSS